MILLMILQIRRMDFDSMEWTDDQRFEFLTSHLLVAAREVQPDIVRLLFQSIVDFKLLHRFVTFLCKK